MSETLTRTNELRVILTPPGNDPVPVARGDHGDEMTRNTTGRLSGRLLRPRTQDHSQH